MTIKTPNEKSKESTIVFIIIITIASLLFAQHYAYVNYLMHDADEQTKIMMAAENLVSHPLNAFKFSQQYWGDGSPVIMLGIGLVLAMLVYAEYLRRKSQHRGEEKGSAKWNNGKMFSRIYTYGIDQAAWAKVEAKYGRDCKSTLKTELAFLRYKLNLWFKGYRAKDAPEDGEATGNRIDSENIRFDMDQKRNLNNNVGVVGAPGSGKTFGLIKPNILQYNTSFVITDPKGDLMHEMGEGLRRHGYHIKVFNLSEMDYSCGYNPFRYIRSDEQVLSLIDCIINNTDDSKAQKGDQFFAKAEKALLLAIFYYLYYFGTEEEKNMRQVMRLLGEAEVSEKGNIESALDKRFKEVATGTGMIKERGFKADPDHVCVRQYRIVKQGTAKTIQGILISAQVRLAPFNIAAVERITMYDTVHLEELGDSKQALFIAIQSGESSYNFLASMMYTQLFSTLYKQCSIDNIYSHQLVKGKTCALRSELFSNATSEARTLEAAQKKQAEWLTYEVKEVEKGDEDMKYTLWQLTSPKGEVVREFQSERERDVFMDALKNGKWKHGDRNTTIPVHFLLDEFKNTGSIPNFDMYLSTMRSYHLSCTIILQSMEQLKSMYKDDWETIWGDCSTQIFLGSTTQDDLEYFSKAIGDATQTVRNISESKGGKGGGSNISYNQDSYSLMKPEKLRTMPPNQCVVLIAYQDPFYDKKFVLTKHKNYKEIKSTYFNDRLYFNTADIKVPEFKQEEVKLDAERTASAAAQQDPNESMAVSIGMARDLAANRRKGLGAEPGVVPESKEEVEEKLSNAGFPAWKLPVPDIKSLNISAEELREQIIKTETDEDVVVYSSDSMYPM